MLNMEEQEKSWWILDVSIWRANKLSIGEQVSIPEDHNSLPDLFGQIMHMFPKYTNKYYPTTLTKMGITECKFQ